jgi:hypothetical protein
MYYNRRLEQYGYSFEVNNKVYIYVKAPQPS